MLQVDAYGGYAKIYANCEVIEAACWAHARRDFWDIYQDDKTGSQPLAKQALRCITALYAIEAEVRGRPPDIRRQAR